MNDDDYRPEAVILYLFATYVLFMAGLLVGVWAWLT